MATDKSHYNKDVKVGESVLDEIRSLGMEKAIKKANTKTASKEFVEAVRRFYPAAVDKIDSTAKARKNASASIASEKKDSPKESSSNAGSRSNNANPVAGPPEPRSSKRSPVASEAVKRRLAGDSSKGHKGKPNMNPSKGNVKLEEAVPRLLKGKGGNPNTNPRKGNVKLEEAIPHLMGKSGEAGQAARKGIIKGAKSVGDWFGKYQAK